MALFGHQISYVVAAMRTRNRPVNAGTSARKDSGKPDPYRAGMQIVISLGILITSCILLLKGQNDNSVKAGSALLGTVVGYWLR
jgi:hypothetical protein